MKLFAHGKGVRGGVRIIRMILAAIVLLGGGGAAYADSVKMTFTGTYQPSYSGPVPPALQPFTITVVLPIDTYIVYGGGIATGYPAQNMTIDSPFLPDASSPWASGFANGLLSASAGISHSVFGHDWISSDFMIYQGIHNEDAATGLVYNYLMVIDMCCSSAVSDPLMPVTPDLLVDYLTRQVGQRTDQLLASWTVRDRDQNLIAGEQAGAFATLTAVERLAGAPVPEPATWALFIGGFGMIGVTMRRQRRMGFRRA